MLRTGSGCAGNGEAGGVESDCRSLGLRRLLARAGVCCGVQGKSSLGLHRTQWQEPEVGLERESSDLGRTESTGVGGERGSGVCRKVTDQCVWPFPALVQPVLAAQQLEWDCGLRGFCILGRLRA